MDPDLLYINGYADLGIDDIMFVNNKIIEQIHSWQDDGHVGEASFHHINS